MRRGPSHMPTPDKIVSRCCLSLEPSKSSMKSAEGSNRVGLEAISARAHGESTRTVNTGGGEVNEKVGWRQKDGGL